MIILTESMIAAGQPHQNHKASICFRHRYGLTTYMFLRNQLSYYHIRLYIILNQHVIAW